MDSTNSGVVSLVHGIAAPLDIPVFGETLVSAILAHPLVRAHFNLGDNTIAQVNGEQVNSVIPGSVVNLSQTQNSKA